jgi:hypothetical protein
MRITPRMTIKDVYRTTSEVIQPTLFVSISPILIRFFKHLASVLQDILSDL